MTLTLLSTNKKNKFPDPKGSLSTETPSQTIAHVNWEVQDARNYKKYSGKEPAEMCMYVTFATTVGYFYSRAGLASEWKYGNAVYVIAERFSARLLIL